MKRLKEQIEKEKDPEVKAEVKKRKYCYCNRRFYGLLGNLHVERIKNCAQNIIEVGITIVRDD